MDDIGVAELRAGFNELPANQQQNIARVVAAGGMHVPIDPGFAGDAIRALVTQAPAVTPADRGSNRDDPVMASSAYAVQLSASDPAAATSWIHSLP